MDKELMFKIADDIWAVSKETEYQTSRKLRTIHRVLYDLAQDRDIEWYKDMKEII